MSVRHYPDIQPQRSVPMDFWNLAPESEDHPPATDTLELWLKIAREATGKFCKWMDSVRSIKAVDRQTLEEIIADAIERSHEQPPATEQEWSDVDNKIELLCEKADKAMPQWFRKQLK